MSSTYNTKKAKIEDIPSDMKTTHTTRYRLNVMWADDNENRRKELFAAISAIAAGRTVIDMKDCGESFEFSLAPKDAVGAALAPATAQEEGEPTRPVPHYHHRCLATPSGCIYHTKLGAPWDLDHAYSRNVLDADTLGRMLELRGHKVRTTKSSLPSFTIAFKMDTQYAQIVQTILGKVRGGATIYNLNLRYTTQDDEQKLLNLTFQIGKKDELDAE